MHQLVFPSFNKNSSEHDHGINIVALDCEWRPEGYYKDNNDIDINRKLLTEEKWTNPAYTLKGSKKMIKSKKKKSSPVSVLQIATRTHVFVIDLLRICRNTGMSKNYVEMPLYNS